MGSPVGPVVLHLALLALSPPAGLALAALARRFEGAERISGGWMAAGALAVAIASVWSATPGAGASQPVGLSPELLLSPGLLLSVALGLCLMTLAAVDVAALRLPDLITLPLAGVGLGLGGLASAGLAERLLGLGLGFGSMIAANAVYVRWRGRQGLGLGDAKLFAAAGAWLGVSALPVVLLLACAGGVAWVAVRVAITGRGALQERLPFGLPLACAFWTVWLLG